jgi:GTPase Era involved in 16S rRNA processing
MNTQQDLDKWISRCINYYNTHSITKNKIEMKTTEERFQQLEQAHARLFNQFNTLHQDFVKYREVMQEQLQNLKGLINLSSTEEAPALPDVMYTGTEYKSVITEIIKQTPTKWKDMEYTNWQIKLEGKEEHYIAFIPTEYTLAAGDKVRFTYTHPFQCKKLKQI